MQAIFLHDCMIISFSYQQIHQGSHIEFHQRTCPLVDSKKTITHLSFCLFRKATIQQLEDAVSAESSSTAAKVKEMQEWQQEHNEAGSLAQPR